MNMKDKGTRKIRLQCSSKHLTLASSVFKAMLSGKFKESIVLRSVGTLELPLPDDDPAALLILLNIIHGRTKEIPRQVDLHMLTQIAILVDKYRLQMVVGMASPNWMVRLKEEIVSSSMEALPRWILISWVFQYPTEFKLATERAEKEGAIGIGRSGDIDLPIPHSIVDAIDRRRKDAIDKLISALHSILEDYQGADTAFKLWKFLQITRTLMAIQTLGVRGSVKELLTLLPVSRVRLKVK
ncbi:hypothetical protein MMC07_000877 [Pseudocyphellaria aurata]|nr:hypothetical protein [Pseudocyphellaria aurata]